MTMKSPFTETYFNFVGNVVINKNAFQKDVYRPRQWPSGGGESPSGTPPGAGTPHPGADTPPGPGTPPPLTE